MAISEIWPQRQFKNIVLDGVEQTLIAMQKVTSLLGKASLLQTTDEDDIKKDQHQTEPPGHLQKPGYACSLIIRNIPAKVSAGQYNQGSHTLRGLLLALSQICLQRHFKSHLSL